DSRHDRMIVFGGFGQNSDVWALEFQGTPTWTRLDILGTAPVERYFHTAVYDSAHDRMIVHGGTNEGTGILSDTWALSLGLTPAWSPLTPAGPAPPARSGHQAIYDPV